MAIRNVLQLGDPGLREVAEPVADPTDPPDRGIDS